MRYKPTFDLLFLHFSFHIQSVLPSCKQSRNPHNPNPNPNPITLTLNLNLTLTLTLYNNSNAYMKVEPYNRFIARCFLDTGVNVELFSLVSMFCNNCIFKMYIFKIFSFLCALFNFVYYSSFYLLGSMYADLSTICSPGSKFP